ncbi:MAG: ABC transporter substrate-binding protein, partial [Cryobacterium sp.]
MFNRMRTVVAVGVLVLAAGCAAQPPPPRVVRVAYHHPAVTLDPHAHDDGLTRCLLAGIFESLVTVSPDNELVPGLADQWLSPDGTTWRLRLRSGVRFHDGRPVEVEDVIASLRRACFNSSLAVSSYLTSVVAVDRFPSVADTVEIRTSEPFPLLLTRLTLVAVMPRDADPARPVGTGPYRWLAGGPGGPMRLGRWEGHWGPPAAFDEVHVEFFDDDNALSALIAAGSVDVVTSVARHVLAASDRRGDWTAIPVRSLATTLLGFAAVPPWNDPRLREAVDCALDRERLAAEAYPDGDAVAARSLLPADVFGHLPTVQEDGPDLARARRLLDEMESAGQLEIVLEHARDCRGRDHRAAFSADAAGSDPVAGVG